MQWCILFKLQENHEIDHEIMLFLLQVPAINSLTWFKKHSTDQNQKGNGYGFNDSNIDCH
jgi:hypothetical protein